MFVNVNRKHFCFFFLDPDLQVQVRRAFSTQAELFCRSFCHLPQRPSFIWYKNGQKIQEDTSSHLDYFDPADSYSCAVRRHEDFPAPSVCEFTPVFHPHNTTWWSFYISLALVLRYNQTPMTDLFTSQKIAFCGQTILTSPF